MHGDYRVGNLLVAEDAPARISAVLDWELSTIGDPLADLGYLRLDVRRRYGAGAGYRRALAGDPRSRASRRVPGSRSGTRSAPAATVAHRLVRGLAHWKAAVFLENMCKRFLAGDRDDDFARAMEQGVPAKLAAAEAAAARDDAAR